MSTAGSDMPVLAVITGHLAPYRIAIQKRLSTELGGIRVATLVTKNQSTMWRARDIPEIGTVLLDPTDVDWYNAPWIPFLRHERRVAKALVRWLETNNVAAVITAGYDEIPVNAAVRWARRRGVPVFLTADSNLRSDTSRGLKRMLKRLIVPRLIRRYTGVMPFGSNGRKFFEYYGADPDRIFYVPLEPDYALLERVSDADVASARAKYGLPASRRRLVCCNRLVPLKRVDQVIDAFAAIAGARSEWDLLIVGDGPLRKELEARVPAALRERVRFLGQIDDMAEIGAIYRASDVLVLASMHEAWGLVVNEALCCGMSAVCSDVVGSVPELVKPGINGEIFSPGDLAGLRGAMERATDPTRADALKAASGGVLAQWRRDADPVEGVRKALRCVGVSVS